MPWPFIPNTCLNDGSVAKRGHASVQPKPSLRACGARPSAARVGHGKNRGSKKGKRPGKAGCRRCWRAGPAPPQNRTPDKENERLQRRDAPVRRDPPLYGRPRPATPRRLSGHRNTWGSEGEMLGRGAGFVYGACWVLPLRGSRPNMVSTACVLLARRCVFGFGCTWCALEASI